MPTRVKLKMKPRETILMQRHLGSNGEAQLKFAQRVAFYAKPYTPKRQEILAKPEVSARKIVYDFPYARYQWYGKVMTGKAPKKVLKTKNLKYSEGGKRGQRWILRMWNDKSEIIIKEMADFCGAKVKR